MYDLKLFGQSNAQIKQLILQTNQVNKVITIEFGVKYATVAIRRNELTVWKILMWEKTKPSSESPENLTNVKNKFTVIYLV